MSSSEQENAALGAESGASEQMSSSDDESSSNESSIESTPSSSDLARSLDGCTVIVGGVGGTICVSPQDRTTVTTSFRKGTPLRIETRQKKIFGGDGADEDDDDSLLVAFRVVGSNRYLSVTMYGDDVRNATAEALSHTPVLPALIPDIVNYVVDRSTGTENFEGAGYNYSPHTAHVGPPGLLQVFSLERAVGGRYGIKSLFNTYWRSQHWNRTVSQAPHCLGDERWTITVQQA